MLRRRCHPRWLIAIGLLLALLVQLLLPRPVAAACGPLDMGACIDNAEYSFYYLIASLAWNVNRWLLLLAYQFDQLRAWLITVAFTSTYQAVTDFLTPAYVPIAVAALMLAAILFMLVPLTGKSSIVSLRHVLIWVVLTPAVLTISGQLIGQAEQTRSDVSAQLFAETSGLAPGAIFGASGSDMPAPVPLYPANPCGTTLTRFTTVGLTLDSLAAALMYADTGDIHCPDARGPSRDIPDGFYSEPPSYAYDGYVGDLDSAVERRGWVEGMQRGMNRLFQGLIPSFLAVLESFIHLIFSLSMVVLWISVPLALLFVWFQQTAAPLSNLLSRAASIFLTSWIASLLMGLVSTALVAAAELGNAGAYTGLALGGLLLLAYLAFVALHSLWQSIGTIERTALSATGLRLTEPLGMAVGLASGTAETVTKGGATALGAAAMGAAAWHTSAGGTTSQRLAYTGAAVASRVSGMGDVGEVATALGWIGADSPLYQGSYVGDRSRTFWRAARLQMNRDAQGFAAGARAGSAPPPPVPPPTPPVPPTAPPAAPPPAPLAPRSAPGAQAAPTASMAVALPTQHAHRVWAAQQLPPLHGGYANATWQYVESLPASDGFAHTFRHPHHPLTQQPETRVITSRAADLAAPAPRGTHAQP
jgi:hypothetical protein